MDRIEKKFILAIAINVLLALGRSDGRIITTQIDGYDIDQNSFNENGQCVQEISVTGNGLRDYFQFPCSETGMDLISSDSVLIYGNPQQNRFSLFSDSPNTLMVIEGGRCMRKTYTMTESGIVGLPTPMSYDDCVTLKNEITRLVEERKRHWTDWGRHFIRKMNGIFSPSFPFNYGTKGAFNSLYSLFN